MSIAVISFVRKIKILLLTSAMTQNLYVAPKELDTQAPGLGRGRRKRFSVTSDLSGKCPGTF